MGLSQILFLTIDYYFISGFDCKSFFGILVILMGYHCFFMIVKGLYWGNLLDNGNFLRNIKKF